jgi:O-antigen/teichoic acid export membrane protein
MWFSRLRCSAGWDHIAMVALRAPALVLPIIAAAQLPAVEVGYLVVVVMIASAFLAVPGAVSSALLADCADDPSRLRAQSGHAARLIAMLLVVPVLIAIPLSRQLLGLFGPGYAHYSVLLILLLLSAFPDALINLALTVLRVQRRLTAVAAATAAGAVMTIGGTWLLMPHLGVFGAALALLTSQAIVATALAVMVFDVTGSAGKRIGAL